MPPPYTSGRSNRHSTARAGRTASGQPEPRRRNHIKAPDSRDRASFTAETRAVPCNEATAAGKPPSDISYSRRNTGAEHTGRTPRDEHATTRNERTKPRCARTQSEPATERNTAPNNHTTADRKHHEYRDNANDTGQSPRFTDARKPGSASNSTDPEAEAPVNGATAPHTAGTRTGLCADTTLRNPASTQALYAPPDNLRPDFLLTNEHVPETSIANMYLDILCTFLRYRVYHSFTILSTTKTQPRVHVHSRHSAALISRPLSCLD